MKVTLSLKRDVLHELTDGELGAVAGGAPASYSCPLHVSCVLADCLPRVRTHKPAECITE